MCTFAEVFRTNCPHYPYINIETRIKDQGKSEGHNSPPRSVAGNIKEKYGRPLQDLGVVSLFGLYRNNKNKNKTQEELWLTCQKKATKNS